LRSSAPTLDAAYQSVSIPNRESNQLRWWAPEKQTEPSIQNPIAPIGNIHISYLKKHLKTTHQKNQNLHPI
jgi:hypothetical protein